MILQLLQAGKLGEHVIGHEASNSELEAAIALIGNKIGALTLQDASLRRINLLSNMFTKILYFSR